MRRMRGAQATVATTKTFRWKSFSFLASAICTAIAVFALSGGAGAMTNVAGSISGGTAPWIATDLSDYAPGATVHVTGGNWQPGEAVQIFTNDSIGNSWSETDNVTADQAGNIGADVTLPTSFIANYSVVATGTSSGTATTTFTDGNVRVAVAGVASASISWTHFGTTTCSGPATGTPSSGTVSANSSFAIAANATGTESVQLVAPATVGSNPFASWVSGSDTRSTRTICVAGTNNSGNINWTANYSAPTNTAPTTPGTPTASANPNQGSFDVSWAVSTDAQSDAITYTLQHKNSAVAAVYSTVTTTTSTSYTFGSANPAEGSGTWTYRVQASDGSLSSAFSADSSAVKVDKQGPSAPTASASHGPEFDPTPATNQTDDWYKDSVTISYSGSTDPALDDTSTGSGVASYTAPQLVNTAGPFTTTGHATDAAGNDSASTSLSGNVDNADPVSSVSATRGAGSTSYASDTWSNQDVHVTLSASDTGGSGVKQIVYSINGDPPVTVAGASAPLAAFTANGIYTITFHAEDNVGHSESPAKTFKVKIDNDPPNAPSATATRAAEYAPLSGDAWWKDSISVHFTDNGDVGPSGVDLATVPADAGPFTSQGAHTASGTVKDNAGNESLAGSLTVHVDNAKPTFGACTGGPFVLNSGSQAVSITASDVGGSGVDTGASTLAGSVSTSTIGPKTVTYSVADNVGHSDTTTCTYQVYYNWTGFFQPVDNDPTCNIVKAGSAIPVKFSLAGNQGLNIFMPGYPAVSNGTCTGSASDQIETTVTAGNSSLNYDATADQYIYVWKTDKAWAGQAKRLTLFLADGSVHFARFSFTR